MRTLPYHFNVTYIKSSANQFEHCLPRPGPLQNKMKLPIVQIHEITCLLQAIMGRIQLLHGTTEQDGFAHLSIVCKLVCHWKSNNVGISRNKSLLKMVFYSKGQESLYPQAKDQTCLRRFMQGIMVYLNALIGPDRLSWPGLYDQIHKLVTLSNMFIISKNNNTQPPSKQLGHDMPCVPLSKLLTDIFNFEDSSHLLVVLDFQLSEISQDDNQDWCRPWFQNMVGLIP